MLLFKREKTISLNILDADWLRGDEEAIESVFSLEVQLVSEGIFMILSGHLQPLGPHRDRLHPISFVRFFFFLFFPFFFEDGGGVV
jgi:hypothetical protein